MDSCIEHQRKRFKKYVVLILFLTTFVFVYSGCTPLKKKFIRQKKKDKEVAFIPVLDPIDYPQVHVSAEERYNYHYSLWWVWHKDLVQKIDDKASDKTQVYLLNQIITQLSEMKKWVVEEKQNGLDQILLDLNKVMALYETPVSMRSDFSVKAKLERIAKKVRNELSPELIKENFINQ